MRDVEVRRTRRSTRVGTPPEEGEDASTGWTTNRIGIVGSAGVAVQVPMQFLERG